MRNLDSKTRTQKVKKSKTPNKATIAAMEELKASSGKKFKSVDDLFKKCLTI